VTDIRYVCMSDMHFGADNSLLTHLSSQDGPVDPRHPSKVLVYLVDGLRALIRENTGRTRPTLILNGDIFELCFGTANLAAMAFQQFLELAMPEKKSERLFDDTIIFIPGNHDHHLWVSCREHHYARYVQSVNREDFILAPTHTSNMLALGGLESPLVNAMVRRCPWLHDVSVQVAYPNFALVRPDKIAMFTHGHFTEDVYMLVSAIAGIAFPDRDPPMTIEECESENFAWIDFIWSALGRSGSAGPVEEMLYELTQQPDKLMGPAVRVANALTRAFDIKHRKPIEKLVHSFLSKAFERNCYEKLLDDDGAGLRRYLEGPVLAQLEAELKGMAPPKSAALIFGHTHKPFEKMFKVENMPWPEIETYNSGGWVIDSPQAQPIIGGAVILLDDDLNIASLRVYNETTHPNRIKPRIETAAKPSNPFYKRLSRLVSPKAQPWLACSSAIAEAVELHGQRIAGVLARND
jgi:UDP-2,3-diacylglucosamine pyrophosphatase LpxH